MTGVQTCALPIYGSAPGGIALAIEATLGIPIKWVGSGEGIDDFAAFEPEAYIQSLL